MEPSPEPPAPVLFVTGGALDGASLPLESPGFEKVMGTGPDCHLRLQGQNVEHHHAQISWEAEGVLLSDLGSASGTYVNGEKVETTRVLADGDRICLGPPASRESVKLLARIPADLAAAAPIPVEAAPEPIFLAAEEDLLLEPGEAAAPDGPAPTLPEPPPTAALTAATAPATLAAKPAVIIEEALAPPTAARRSAPDYTEGPAIAAPPGAGRARASAPVPTAKKPAARAPARLPALPPRAWAALGAAALLFSGAAGWLVLRRPAPQLASLNPVVAVPGQAVTLDGAGFDETPGGNIVRFGERTASVTSASKTQLVVPVPPELPATGTTVAVSVETAGGRTSAVELMLKRAPRAVRLQPDVVLPGAEVTLFGQNLDMKGLGVRVDGVPAEVRDAEAASLRFVVPAMPVGGGRAAKVIAQAGADSTTPLTLLLGRLPFVAEVVPARARVGERVAVRGRGFDPGGSRVTVGGEAALVVAATATELAISIPNVRGGGGAIPAPLVVEAAGSASEPASFAVDRPSSSFYVPRFFAAGTGDRDTVFVSVELGPVLLLASADGAVSVAARALQAASALNALLQAPGAESLRFEARPPDMLAVAGQGALLRATAADAAAYDRALITGVKGQRLTPAALAAHWAALLQDLVTLFVAHQRPLTSMERSGRGKVLLEIYAEGARRGGSGVPLSIVEPLAPTTARAFRELALQPAAGGRGVPGAAVVGVWEGMLHEEGVGERAVRLRLDVSGSRLVGFLTTRAGALSMDVTLRDVGYDKGTLTFAMGGGANERRFRGIVHGAAVSGTVHGPAEQPVGQFSLRLVE